MLEYVYLDIIFITYNINVLYILHILRMDISLYVIVCECQCAEMHK